MERTINRRRLVQVAAVGAGLLMARPVVAQDEIIIGLVTKTDTNPFFVKMKEGFEQEAKKSGAKTMTAAGKFDGDNASQVTAIENMVTAGAKGILITPSDTKAIVPTIEKARDAGVLVIALDTPTQPESAVDALFATDNFKAGVLIGQYARAAMGDKEARIAMLDLAPGISVGVLRHNGFVAGFTNDTSIIGTPAPMQEDTTYLMDDRIVASADTRGDQSEGQTGMENCLQRDPDINLVYTINEPAALGAYTAIKNAGKENDVMIVSIDGGRAGVEAVKDGKLAATSQQYPLKMASMGVQAVMNYVNTGEKPSGYVDTGVTLITDNPQEGVPSKDTTYGLENAWG